MKHVCLSCLFVLLVLSALSVSRQHVSAAATDLPAIRKLIDQIPVLLPVKEDEQIANLPTTVEDYFGTPSEKRSKQHNLTKGFEQITAFGYDPTLMYPGSVLQGKYLSEGSIRGVKLPRASGVVTVSNLQFVDGSKYSEPVADVGQDTMEAAVRKLLSQKLAGPPAARISFSKSEMFSLEQGMVSVGIDAKWMGAELKSSLEHQTLTKKSSYVIRFTQIYYDLSFKRPLEAEQFFSDKAKLNTAQQEMDAVNPPTYISTMSYGRTLFVFFSADESSDKLVASIDAAYSAGFSNLATHLAKEQLQVLKNSDITVLALGGAPKVVSSVIAGDKIANLENYMTAGQDFSPQSQGYPIAYTVKHVRDDSVAKLGFTTNYVSSIYSPIPAIKALQISFRTQGDDKDRDESVSMWVRNGTWTMATFNGPFGIHLEYWNGGYTGTEIGTGTWGQGDEWGDPSNRDFEIDLQKPFPLSQCSNLRFRLRKNPDHDTGSGWKMRMTVRGVLVNGQSIPLAEWDKTDPQIGDGKPYDFFNATFSCPPVSPSPESITFDVGGLLHGEAKIETTPHMTEVLRMKKNR